MTSFLDSLTIDGAPAGEWSVTDGVLTMSAPPVTDLFASPASDAPERPSAARLVTEVSGDFVFSARVEVEFRSTFDAGVLYVEADAEQWFKLCLEFTPLGQPSVVSVVTRGLSDDANSWTLDVPYSHFRVSRMGRAFALHARGEANVPWSLVRHFTLGTDEAAPVKAGFLAQSPTGDGCTARFSEISFESRTLGAIRSGE
jgi:regulation of enolase protein 1 (concanavalin A-like superfamily)